MVKLDVAVLKYMTSDCWRILQAIEMGMRNHQLVPTDLIFKLGGLKRGGSMTALSTVHKVPLSRARSRKHFSLTPRSTNWCTTRIKCTTGTA